MAIFCDMFCERCVQSDRLTLAHYVLLAEKEALTGTAAGGPARAEQSLQWHRLCAPHHAELSDDERMAYVPTVYAGPEAQCRGLECLGL